LQDGRQARRNMLFAPKHQAVVETKLERATYRDQRPLGAVRGQRARLAITSEARIKNAMTKRMPANVIGGRSARPSLMNSHVDPQIQQRISQTMRAFIYLFVREVGEDVKASGKSVVS